ncbi:DDE-type integrase/transposase/recombinase [Aliarcobacter cryaerophilus]|uniref:DDE-type integrase/transposase/recombinase n=1 Tax=Aliarcobacter cryaerophilus TaxID=28198 RepID=UPI0021B64B87|nr:DDE-type integrase/transposase/recombinase [Aliarcobacter cryaerophilus]MCT7499462.1 DDE-type integrase/transposase/recombinase [Aliarcobacter cryaerophilus]
MTSKEIASLVGCTEQYIRATTKKALENGLKTIEIKGLNFSFEVVSNSYGKSYVYETLATPTAPKKEYRVNALRVEDLKKISHIDIRASKINTEDKFLIVTLIREINCSLEAIVKSLCLEFGHIATQKECVALVKKISRWVEAFKIGGKKALEDKRGAKKGEFKKLNEKLLRLAIFSAKALANRDGFEKVHIVYSHFLSKEQGIVFTNPSDVVAYSSIVSGVKTLFKKDYILKDYMTKGWDGLLQAYPVGVRDIAYPNQEWQVDATKADFMVRKSDGTIGRLNYTVVMDTHTGAYVGSLSETINSYDQTKVLYEAICKMGKPELVRMDNGRDYTSNHYQEFTGFLGAGVVFADVGQGRQKGKVERNFGVIQNRLALLPGYIGNNVAKRTLIENQTASKIDVRTSKATRIKEHRLLTEEELRTLLEIEASKQSKSYSMHSNSLLSDLELEKLRKNLGKTAIRTVSESGINYNNTIYTGSVLWTYGLKKGDKVVICENIDDVNCLFVHFNDEFVGEIYNKNDDRCMSIDDYKKSKKAYIKNHITPITKEILEAQRKMEEFQDELVQATLGEAPQYLQKPLSPKTIKSKKTSNVASTSSSIQDDLDYFENAI